MTLGDFIPPGEVPRKRPNNRRQRLSLRLEGMEGSVSSRVPLWSDRDRLKEMPAVPDGSPLRRRTVRLGPDEELTCSLHSALASRRRRRRRKPGLRGIVSNHIPTYTVRAYRSWPQPRRPAAPAFRPPRPVVSPSRPPAAGRGAYMQEPADVQQPSPRGRHAHSNPRVPRTRTTSNLVRPASREPTAQVVADPPPAPPKTAHSSAAGSPPSGSQPVPNQSDEATRDRKELEQSSHADEEATRLQLIVEIGGKATTAHAQLTDWKWITSLGLTDLTGEGAVERMVVKALLRALNLKTVSSSPRHMRLEPIRPGSGAPALSIPNSWESLATFTQLGGTFRAIGSLQGGRDLSGSEPARANMFPSHLAAPPRLIEQVKDLAPSTAQENRRASPPPLPTPNAQA